MLKPRERHAVIPLTSHHVNKKHIRNFTMKNRLFQAVIVGGRHEYDSEQVHMEVYDYRTGFTFASGKTGPARPGISGAQITSEILT